jgi:hypothetical protein
MATKSVGIAALVIVVALVVAACGSSSTTAKSTPSPSTSLSAAAQIKANWELFFAGTTSATRKIALLQNGQQFATTIQAQAGSAIAKGTEATVSAVKVVSPTTATVTYSILLNGQPALTNQTGQAVLVDGVWKVGAQSFTALLTLEGKMSSPAPSATATP